MTGRAAEALQPKEYSRSVANLVQWGGELAVENAIGQPAEQGLREQNFDDYASGLREMLRTDSEFSDQLDLEDKRDHLIVDGRARAANGQAMVDIVAEGRRGSERMAADYPEWEPQAIRDAGDEIIAGRADALEPGQVLFAVSLNPDRALRDHNELYKRLGYRELSYVQYYARTPDGKMVAGSYSVDDSDLETWRALLADRGREVPEEADDNTFIRYSFEVTATPEEADELALDMRGDYYERRGTEGRRYSVTEYLALHEETVQTFFDAYYPSLAEAAESGQNNEVMQGFAETLLAADVTRLKPEIKRTLIRVANANGFDYHDTKVMESVIRYAVVEQLRKGLKTYVGEADAAEPEAWSPTLGNGVLLVAPGEGMMAMNRLMADNVSTGLKAGRSYGGCPGQVELSQIDEAEDGGTGEPQSAYGGRGSKSKFDPEEDCEFTSEECPECHAKKVRTVVTRVRGKRHVEGSCGCSKTYN